MSALLRNGHRQYAPQGTIHRDRTRSHMWSGNRQHAAPSAEGGGFGRRDVRPKRLLTSCSLVKEFAARLCASAFKDIAAPPAARKWVCRGKKRGEGRALKPIFST